jgi:hypothetical protein
LHQSVGADVLRLRYRPDELRGFLAWVGGLVSRPDPLSMDRLLADFDWKNVGTLDRVVTWDGHTLA